MRATIPDGQSTHQTPRILLLPSIARWNIDLRSDLLERRHAGSELPGYTLEDADGLAWRRGGLGVPPPSVIGIHPLESLENAKLNFSCFVFLLFFFCSPLHFSR